MIYDEFSAPLTCDGEDDVETTNVPEEPEESPEKDEVEGDGDEKL